MPPPSSFRPTLESLESRELPSTTPLPTLAKPEQSHAFKQTWNAVLPDAPPFSSSRATFEHSATKFRFDRHGIVETNTGATHRWELNPLNIARYTIALYRAYRQGDRTALAPMRNHARWLMAHIETRRDAGGRAFRALPYSYGLPDFQAPAGFTSGLASASASCALLLAGQAQHRVDWQRMSYQLLSSFNVPVAQGGLRSRIGPTSSHAAWYEEVAHPRAPPAHILNGHLYATSWLGWYSRTAKLSPHARQWAHGLFQQGVNGINLLLSRFDEPSIMMSVYDLTHRGRHQNYHDAHVILLDYYYRVTGVAEFQAYANRWRGRVYPA